MSDDQQPSPLDRRRFLTVLGVTAGGGALALSGCSTDRVREAGALPGAVGGPGPRPRHLVRQHLHRVRQRAAASTCGPARAARSSSRAIPTTRSTRASSAPAARRRSRGCTTRGGSSAPMAARRRRQLHRDHLGRRDRAARGQADRGGRQGRGASAARVAGPSPISWPSGPAALGGQAGPLRDLRPRADAGREPPGLRSRPAAGARLRPGQVHRLLRRRLPGQLGLARSRTSAASPGRTDSARATSPSSSTPAPRRDLTGLNADEWLPITPGSETALALAMANVLVSERGDARGLASALSPVHSRRGRAGDRPAGGADRAAGARVRGGPPEPRGGRAASARSTRRAPSCAPRSTCSTSWRATSGRRCASAPISPHGRRLRRAGRAGAGAWTADEVAVAAGARRQSGVHPAQGQRVRRAIREGGASRCPPRCTWTRPPPSATCCCRSITRSSGGTTSRPRAGVYGLMQPVMEPVFNTLPAGDILLRVSKKAGGALAKFTAPSWESHLKTRWQALAAELGEADAAGFWHARGAARRRVREPPASPQVALAARERRARLHQSPRSKGMASSSS